jgi:hypothetical protein
MLEVAFIFLFIAIIAWINFTPDDEFVLLKLAFKKLDVYYRSLKFMVLSKDSKGLGAGKNPDPDDIKGLPAQKKTIVFIRHGESDWNNVFNKGINPSLLIRLGKSMSDELKYFPTSHSVFIDSPLNLEGIEQAYELSQYIEEFENKVSESDPAFPILAILSGKVSETTSSSIVVSSSLRRAVATTTVALWNRLNYNKTTVHSNPEKIYILSSLQEISRNVDTYALSPANSIVDLPFARVEKYCKGLNPSLVYDCSQNFGNKGLSFTGIKRLQAFNEWAFQRKEDVIIVGGHSLWFKYYFQTFLPHHCNHDAKKFKIVNSGVVAMTVSCSEYNQTMRYRIEPESIINVFGGFTAK